MATSNKAAYQKAYQERHREKIREYNRIWARNKRANKGAVSHRYGLPAQVRDLFQNSPQQTFALADICVALPKYKNRDISRTLRALFLGGVCTRETYMGLFQYKWNPVQVHIPVPRRVKAPEIIKPVPEFDTVPWLGGVIRTAPPLEQGRQYIAQEMQVVDGFDKAAWMAANRERYNENRRQRRAA